MFSKGQQFFALFFIIAFIIVLIWSYRKDLKVHRRYYQSSWVIALLVILVVFALFAAVSYFLHE